MEASHRRGMRYPIDEMHRELRVGEEAHPREKKEKNERGKSLGRHGKSLVEVEKSQPRNL